MYWPAVRNELLAQGISAGVWFTDGSNLSYLPDDADFVIVEVEGESDHQGIINNPTPSVPHAILTNFGPYNYGDYLPEKAAPLIDAGWVCMTECYLSENGNATPDRMNFTAINKLGWDRTQPCFGFHGGKDWGDYSAWLEWPGWAIYLAEYVL